jgi:ABC-type Fe3+-hydroxamate transport system substrate-binding protein
MKCIIAIVALALLTSACGDLFSMTGPSTSKSITCAQAAGSTVSILDATVPAC